MKGRLIDLALGLNGKQRITLEVDADFREKYDALKNSDIRVEIVKYREPRSKDANAYFHVLVNNDPPAKPGVFLKRAKPYVTSHASCGVGTV